MLNTLSKYAEILFQGGFYQGHPFPSVKKEGNKITLDFQQKENGESFYPAVKTNQVELYKQVLKAAITVAIQKVILK